MATPSLIAFVSRLPALTLSAADADAPVTSWIQVSVVGKYKHAVYGEFEIAAADNRQMEENFRLGRYPVPPTEICIDYDHLSMDPKSPGDGKAAGWIKQLELRAGDDELWARVEWTDAGKQSVGSKEYKFVSPTFLKKFKTNTGDEIGCTLIGAAITNLPFLQGMQPASIAASALGARGAKDLAVIRLAEFSFEERLRRIGEALAHHLGCDEWAIWIVDAFDDRAYYRRHGALYEIGYSIAENGTVTFGTAPTEAVVSYTTLRPGADPMKTITLKDANGKDVQVDVTSLEGTELVKELRGKVPTAGARVVADADFVALNASITSLKEQVTTLSATVTDEQTKRQAAETKLAAQETATKERDADEAVAKLLSDGKLLPKQTAWAKSLALSSPEAFKAFAADAPVVSPVVAKPFGSGGAPPASSGTALSALTAKAAALRQANPNLTQEQAEAQALDQNPSLYAALDAEHGTSLPTSH